MPAPPNPAFRPIAEASNGSTPIGRCPGCCSMHSLAIRRRVSSIIQQAAAFRVPFHSSRSSAHMCKISVVGQMRLQVRYISPYPLIEDNSVRSDPSTIANLRVGYKFNETWSAHFDILNLFNSEAHDIDYFYCSRIKQDNPATLIPCG